MYDTFWYQSSRPKPICLPRNQRSVRPSPSLTSTTPHIAAKGKVVEVGALSVSATAAVTMGAAPVPVAGRSPLLEAKDGGCNAPVAAPSTIAFSTRKKDWFFSGHRGVQVGSKVSSYIGGWAQSLLGK